MMPPKTAIIGATGFMGKFFFKAYRETYHDCIGTSRDADRKDMFFLDLSAPAIAPLGLAESGHQDALILAGMINLAECEQEKGLTKKINVEGVSDLVKQLARDGIKPIFFSSDIIFDGVAGLYDEGSIPNPLNEYAKQKVEVESRIKEICRDGNYLIFRFGKTFSLEKGDGTLLDEMASTLKSGGSLRAAYDQIFSPIFVLDVINIVMALQMKNVTGVINISSPEVWSRYDLAVALGECMGVDSNRVKRISLDDLQETFKRPKNTSIKASKILREIDYKFKPMMRHIEQIAESWR